MAKLTQAQMGKLIEHSKQHKGGMRGVHMRNMIRFMEAGDSFAKAHSKAMKLDKEKSSKKPQKKMNKKKM